MTFGVIPAVGLSRRMGRAKLSLPLRGRTVLEHVLDALRLGEVGPTVVVLGPHVASLAEQVEAAGARVCLLAAPTRDMRETIEQGLNWLEQHFRPPADADWLLVPADHPTLDATLIQQLRQARTDHPDHSILVPTWEGRRGHPTLIAWRHVAGIRAHAPGQGLNTYLRQHAAETFEVAWSSPAILEDLDTPEDYERMLRNLQPRKDT
jgi:molybdenum cofactor cytidylyltransferase